MSLVAEHCSTTCCNSGFAATTSLTRSSRVRALAKYWPSVRGMCLYGAAVVLMWLGATAAWWSFSAAALSGRIETAFRFVGIAMGLSVTRYDTSAKSRTRGSIPRLEPRDSNPLPAASSLFAVLANRRERHGFVVAEHAAITKLKGRNEVQMRARE